MNAAQQTKYFWEWGRCRDYYLSRGLSHAQADAKRHELHVQALGRDKSSKLFTNTDLDKVLAKFRAVFDGGNLDAQLDILDQPEKRRAAMEARIMTAGRAFITGNDKDHIEWKTIAYVGGICTKLGIERRWPMADEKLMAKVMGIMERRAAQIRAKEKGQNLANTAVASACEEDKNENPF